MSKLISRLATHFTASHIAYVTISNTCTYQLSFRGTKDYIVSIANETLGPWQVIARGMFDNLIPQVGTFSPVKVDLTVKPVDPPVKGRFVKYECVSNYGGACALHYVGVVQRRNMQQVTPNPQGMFDVGSL